MSGEGEWVVEGRSERGTGRGRVSVRRHITAMAQKGDVWMPVERGRRWARRAEGGGVRETRTARELLRVQRELHARAAEAVRDQHAALWFGQDTKGEEPNLALAVHDLVGRGVDAAARRQFYVKVREEEEQPAVHKALRDRLDLVRN